jgi:hypothetical protein
VQWCAGLATRRHQHWREVGHRSRAEALARYAWQAGGLDPRLVAAHAGNLATAGGVEQLQRGLEVGGEALLTQACSTDDGWRDLRSTQGRIAGQLTRRSFKPSGDIDENGNPVPVRRHQPQTPQRTRAGRFSLAG